jgi:3-mercaptopyruvate sulfurtransferase SseA
MPSLLSAERPVTDVPAAPSPEALAHFEKLLAFETDCWDVHAALAAEHPGFVVLDVRSAEAFAAGHVPGAVSLPHRRINERNLALARLGRPVKKMIGGVTGWNDEGFDFSRS